MTKEQIHRLHEIVSELKELLNQARQIRSTPTSKAALAEVVNRATELAQSAAMVAGGEVAIGQLTGHLAEAQLLIDHWDELMPVWEAREKLGHLLETLPRAPESIPPLLVAARELQRALHENEALLPASYAQPQVRELDQLLASVPPALRGEASADAAEGGKGQEKRPPIER